ncbi:uncharacterized protein LOC131005480 [Salvia miltiorrhiza]|uniref:uncharacterized protein LOC131005480 n=1 Tax=Salvia miltiorrhiza TaxID=226208 RepID=UPI0025AC2B8D|nr:uncharacterized protein LOC131005480 [Salvia miltiorrhiza]
MLTRQSSLLQQQSRITWLSDGDRNTKFYQNKVKYRRSRLNIKQLVIDDIVIDNHDAIAGHVVQFYVDLFAAHPTVVDRSWIHQHIPSLLTIEQGAALIDCPTEDEIRAAVFSMNSNGAPGPDGFNRKFFQVAWEIVGADIIAAVQRFFTRHYLPVGFNSNFLTLLPKKVDASSISDYRPIVLGNFLFKIITKVLATRLNIIAPSIISPNQFGFVAGHSIHEGILLASEGVNCMNRSLKGNNIALKVDIKKAFDTLDWQFVNVVLQAFGFPATFRNWIQIIFYSARISIMFKGTIHGFFSCGRGVRQGDPLSPLIFSLAEEVLSRLLLHAADNNFIAQMRMSRQLLFPSHLLYADDVLLFCRASKRSCVMINSILQLYASVSGQHCNIAKSTIYFGKGVCTPMKRRVQRVLGFAAASLPFIYLGVPVFTGRACTSKLRKIKDFILSKFSRWKSLHLSMAGRVVHLDWLLHDHGSLFGGVKSRLRAEGVREPIQQVVEDTFCILGNGDSISFWLDNWLGYKLVDRLHIPHYMFPFFSQRVSNYFFNDTWHFTDSFIEAFSEVAFDIIYIPFSDDVDYRAWTHSRFGELSAALAFDYLAPSYPIVDWGKWIWATFIPVRRSITCWKVILGRLPTTDTLRRCGFVGPSFCSLCRNALERIEHIFWECFFAKEVWSNLFSWFGVDIPLVHDVGSLIIQAMRFEASAQMTSLWRLGVVTLIWGLWSARNQAAFHDVQPKTQAMVSLLFLSFKETSSNFRLGCMANSIRELQVFHRLKVPGNPRPTPVIVDVIWKLPPPLWLKANIDGSIRGEPAAMHAGGVIRNAFNLVIVCYHFSVGPGFPFEVELLALLIILERAATNNWYNLWVESDSTYVVNIFNNRSTLVPWHFRGHWLAAPKGVAHCSIMCSHIFREGNKVADFMASSVSQDSFWYHSLSCYQ